MNLAGLNPAGIQWAQMRNPQAILEQVYLSYTCKRCDVDGYSAEPPHACWCCGQADLLARR